MAKKSFTLEAGRVAQTDSGLILDVVPACEAVETVKGAFNYGGMRLDIKSPANDAIRQISRPSTQLGASVTVKIPPFYKTRLGIGPSQSATTAPIPIATTITISGDNADDIRYIPPELLLTTQAENEVVQSFQNLSQAYISGARHVPSEHMCITHLRDLKLKNLRDETVTRCEEKGILPEQLLDIAQRVSFQRPKQTFIALGIWAMTSNDILEEVMKQDDVIRNKVRQNLPLATI